jgi:hypothetical protein
VKYVIPFSSPGGGECRRVSLFPVALAMAFLIILSGCGKKADPVLPTVFLPRAVSELRVQRVGAGISLTWEMPVEARGVTRFRILRSEHETGGTREYLLIDDLAPDAPQLVRERGGKYRYNDFTVRPGRTYAYRVQACYEPELCSEARDSAEMKFD